MKPVKSRDPRKPAIVAALKMASGCRKVTSVTEVAPNIFEGTCMWPFEAHRRQVDMGVPACAAAMGCLCAGHARGNSSSTACDTRE